MVNLIALLLMLGIDPVYPPPPPYAIVVANHGYTILCPKAYMLIEAIVEIPYEGIVVCKEEQYTPLTNIPMGYYREYNLIGTNLITGVEDHPNCGERAWNDLRGIIFPYFVENSHVDWIRDPPYSPMLHLMKRDMHEACHQYWLDESGY